MKKVTRIEFARTIAKAGRIFTKTLPDHSQPGVVEYYVSINGEPVMIGLLVQTEWAAYRYLATQPTAQPGLQP